MNKEKDPIAQPLACSIQPHISQIEFYAPTPLEAAVLRFDFEITTLKDSKPCIYIETENYHMERQSKRS